jgi:hypothetical protein
MQAKTRFQRSAKERICVQLVQGTGDWHLYGEADRSCVGPSRATGHVQSLAFSRLIPSGSTLLRTADCQAIGYADAGRITLDGPPLPLPRAHATIRNSGGRGTRAATSCECSRSGQPAICCTAAFGGTAVFQSRLAFSFHVSAVTFLAGRVQGRRDGGQCAFVAFFRKE